MYLMVHVQRELTLVVMLRRRVATGVAIQYIHMIKPIYKKIPYINWPAIIAYGTSCTVSITCWYYLLKTLNIIK